MGRKLTYKLPPLLEKYMNTHRWDIKTLARVADIREQRLYDNIKGVNPMSLDTALSILKAFGLDEPGQEEDALRLLKQLNRQVELRKSNKL